MFTHKELIEYCLTFGTTYEDYPFDDKTTVMRHKSNKKSFALIMVIQGNLCINLKCEPMRAELLRNIYVGVQAGFHMNKKHWNTIVVDSDVPDEELMEMINHSYDLVKPKVKRMTAKK